MSEMLLEQMPARCSAAGIHALPIAAALQELRAALKNRTAAVLVAPPGAGKTTCVPLSLLNAAWLKEKRMLMLAPRRLAVRAAAGRMAWLLDEPVGATVGYRIRMESRVGPRTRIEVVTEGILTRMLQSDPALPGVGLVIFDEFHERNLDADLGLALCREAQAVFNHDLRLLVMSATLDPAPVAALLDNAPLIRCEGRAFPVDTRYVPPASGQPIEKAVADQILRSVSAGEGNILAFLPGAAEIKRTARRLAEAGPPDAWDVAPLYGLLPRARQDAAIAPPPGGRHKIVLSTAIAETSLTIEQVQVVVDSGLRRAPRYDPRSGLTRLITLPVSRASADQRRGRAGRLGPGVCYRLWSQDAHTLLAERDTPEILDADLCAMALELALWGAAPEELAWLDPPPGGAFAQARNLLADLGALDEKGRITPHGRDMAELPLHPRLAHMLLRARAQGNGAAACDMAALLSERDPLGFPDGRRDADLGLRLGLLRAARERSPVVLSDNRVDENAVRRIERIAAVLRRRLSLGREPGEASDIGRLLAWAYPDRVARRRPQGVGRYLMSNGRGACFDAPEPLSVHEWLVIAELDGDRRDARIFLAAAYDSATLSEQFASQLHWRAQVVWDDARQAVTAERHLWLGALIVRCEPLANPDPGSLIAAMCTGIRAMGIAALPWTPGLRALQARVETLRRLQAGAEQWPDFSDAALMADLEQWLAPFLEGVNSLKTLARLDLGGALHSRLTWRQRQLLDALAPTHMAVPSGRRLAIDYSSDPPVLAVRVQEMFGVVETPAIVEGRLPLTLHLLSPAGRPVQITSDLAGFWRNSYPAVKKELKGRYPKHPWPDDPLHAAPTARATPKKRAL